MSAPRDGVSVEVHQKLSAALRAQVRGLGAQPPGGPAPARGPAHARPGLSGPRVLVLAVLLGAMAGAVAGVISAW